MICLSTFTLRKTFLKWLHFLSKCMKVSVSIIRQPSQKSCNEKINECMVLNYVNKVYLCYFNKFNLIKKGQNQETWAKHHFWYQHEMFDLCHLHYQMGQQTSPDCINLTSEWKVVIHHGDMWLPKRSFRIVA